MGASSNRRAEQAPARRRPQERRSAPAERVLAVVSLLAQEAGPLALGEIADRTGISRGTCLPLLRTLVSSGWAIKVPAARTYLIGAAPLAIHGMATVHGSWFATARAAADALAATCEMRVALSAVVDDELISVYETRGPNGRSDGAPSAPLYGPTGHRWQFAAPYGATIAAWLPGAERRAWWSRGPSAMASDADDVEGRLRSIRDRGYNVHRFTTVALEVQHLLATTTLSFDEGVRRATDMVLARGGLEPLTDQELEADESIAVGWVAAPVLDPEDRPVLAMSLDVDGAPLGRAQRGELGALVVAHAAEVTARIRTR